MMVARNDKVGLTFHGTFENAVVRIIINNRNAVLGVDCLRRFLAKPQPLQLLQCPEKLIDQNTSRFIDYIFEVKLAISPEATSSKILAGLLAGKFKPETMTLVSSTTLSIGWFGSILVNEALDVFLL